jgi:hypothetical protein
MKSSYFSIVVLFYYYSCLHVNTNLVFKLPSLNVQTVYLLNTVEDVQEYFSKLS